MHKHQLSHPFYTSIHEPRFCSGIRAPWCPDEPNQQQSSTSSCGLGAVPDAKISTCRAASLPLFRVVTANIASCAASQSCPDV